ncbi:dienelactone hydrolase [Xylogone sp. PMI_703]|nr:dienelactone hydrolase [Xylogone sp. PMI_703]
MSCPACFSGEVHEQKLTGRETIIHGLPTYVAEPSNNVKPKGIVVILTDVFGWKFVNNRGLADRYAKHGGFLVYLPDVMNGHAVDPSALSLLDKINKPASWLVTIFKKPLWILRALTIAIPFLITCRKSVCAPRIFKFFKDIRASPPPFDTQGKALKVGAAGFCWGGYYTFLLAHDQPSARVAPYSASPSGNSSAIVPLIDAAFTAHPSMLKVPDDVEATEIPMSVSVGDNDVAMKAPDILKMREILEGKNKKGDDVDHECVILPGAKHGFAIRTETEPYQIECAEKAEKQAISWFERWFGK